MNAASDPPVDPPVPPEDLETLATLIAQAQDARHQGRLEDVVSLCKQALAISPQLPDALHLMGLSVFDLGMIDPGLTLLRAAAEASDDSAVWADLAHTLGRIGRLEDAAQIWRKAITLDPDNGPYLWELGRLLRRLRRPDDAIRLLTHACRLMPHRTDCALLLGQTLYDLRRPAKALEHLTRVLVHHPGLVAGYCLSGLCHQMMCQLDHAAQAFRRALAFTPNDPVALGNLALIQQLQGDIEPAILHYDQALSVAPTRADLISNRLMAEQYRVGVTAHSLLPLHQRLTAPLVRQADDWLKAAGMPPLPDPAARTEAEAGHPLRIGYLSADLGKHPVGNFLSAVLPYHDPSVVAVTVYSDRSEEDDLSTHLKGLPTLTWHKVAGDPTPALMRRIRQDGIDLLIDLAGHTASNRMPLFAGRVAPVQLTWAGYVGTTGLATMDGLIADRYHVPIGEEDCYSERIYRLPDGYVPYAPPPYLPDITAGPCQRSGLITFGCTNGLSKLNETVADLWARLLARCPDSRLVLKTDSLSDLPTAARIQALFVASFTAHRVSMDRFAMAGRTTHRDHLSFYGKIDILLDPFPYSGGLTTLESLWMGVPVITRPGATFAGRHSTSHLSVAGLADLCVAEDEASYLHKAITLARDPTTLSTLRSTLRARMQASPTSDGPTFTRALEQLYRQAWADSAQPQAR